MQFRIVGADRETGEDVEIIVEAPHEVDAETIAIRRNILVTSVQPVRSVSPQPQHSPAIAEPLKQCPKCKQWIDKGATKCPQCRSAQPAPKWARVFALLIFISTVLSCGGVCITIFSIETEQATLRSPSDQRKERLEGQFSAWDGSHPGLTAFIQAGMNDPDSYKHIQTGYSDHGDYLLVRTTFRGKNAFGGVVKNSITAKVDLDGNVIAIIEQGP